MSNQAVLWAYKGEEIEDCNLPLLSLKKVQVNRNSSKNTYDRWKTLKCVRLEGSDQTSLLI